MSFQVGSGCYPTALSAATASASQSIGGIVNQKQASYVVDVGTVTPTSITYLLYPIGGGMTITTTTPYTAQPCQMLTAADGVQMGWMVAAAWIAVYAVMHVSRGLFQSEVSHGNT